MIVDYIESKEIMDKVFEYYDPVDGSWVSDPYSLLTELAEMFLNVQEEDRGCVMIELMELLEERGVMLDKKEIFRDGGEWR